MVMQKQYHDLAQGIKVTNYSSVVFEMCSVCYLCNNWLCKSRV